jgi:tetratricopeptide (TPR) repeat protein
MDYFQMAIDKAPNWAPPYAGLANSWFLLGFQMQIPWNRVIPKTDQYLNKALELDPDDAFSHYTAALIAVWAEWDWDKGEREFLKALELNPSDALCRMYYAHLLTILRRSDEAVYQANMALEQDPMDPLVLSLNAAVMKDAGIIDTAIFRFEKALSINPNFGFALSNLELTYFASGDYEKWINLWKKIDCWNEEVKTAVEKALHKHGHIAAIEEMLRQNEVHGREGCQMGDVYKFIRYKQANNYEKAIDLLEKLYEISWSNMPYLATNEFGYEHLKDNPRYIELLKKMNLPLP